MTNNLIKVERSFNDRIDDIHCMLCEDDQYLSYLYANNNKEAAEGSLFADNVMAAQMVRDQAKKIGSIEVASEKLATIRKALGVVLRRYGASRKERRRQDGHARQRDERPAR